MVAANAGVDEFAPCGVGAKYRDCAFGVAVCTFAYAKFYLDVAVFSRRTVLVRALRQISAFAAFDFESCVFGLSVRQRHSY